jgi:hypothetical protein
MAQRAANERNVAAKVGLEPTPQVIEVDEIVLDGVKVQVRNQNLALESVALDPTNPRIAYSVRMENASPESVNQQVLENMLWRDPDVRQKLFDSVLTNGGLVERIIVRSNGWVAEGNCRVIVYRKLREQRPDDPRWQTIPARVLPADITERQIAKLLGEMHVGGKNAWSSFEKAAHVHRLFTEYGLTQEEIAKLLRTSKSAVNHNIRAFGVMETYLAKFGGEGAVHKFSYFVELFKKPELRAWAAEDAEAIELFSEWVGKGKIARGEHVRELKDIVSNPRALHAFKEQGREAAQQVLQLDKPELTSPLFKAMAELTASLELAKLDDVQRVRREPAAKRIVKRLNESFERFLDLCGGMD